jgi:hypothetical protein
MTPKHHAWWSARPSAKDQRKRSVDARVADHVDLPEHGGKEIPCHKRMSVAYSSNKKALVQGFLWAVLGSNQ